MINTHCEHVEGAVMANHTSSGGPSDEGEGSKQDTQPEPQIDSVMHKDLLDAVLPQKRGENRRPAEKSEVIFCTS